jgi:hypothetical protein
LETARPSGTPAKLNREAVMRSLGYTPHAGQAEIHASTALRRIVASGVRYGKTRCAAIEGLLAALEPKESSVGWVVAPTYDLAEKVYREVVLLVSEHLKHRLVSHKEHEKKLVLRNMAGGLSEIRAKSADNPISLLGEGLDWLICDEAARLKPLIWNSYLSQRLIDKRGWALLISTPRGKGWFYEMWRRGQPGGDPDFQSWNQPSWANPYLDASLIERERARIPERVFDQEYGAQFLEGAGTVFRNVPECATGRWQEPIVGKRYFAGLDLARVEDFTVLVIINEAREVVFVDRFHRLDWAIQVGRIHAACDRYNDCQILCDTTGAGEPIYEALRLARCRVKGYPLSHESKTALINNLALMTEQRLITLPTSQLWPEGIEELEAYEFSVTDSGNVTMSSPSGSHDDCVIATALAAWWVRRRQSAVCIAFA